jgi:hypothetical protein
MQPSSKPVLLDETKKLELSEIVDNSKINNANAFKDRTRLDDLQEWIRAQIEIYK